MKRTSIFKNAFFVSLVIAAQSGFAQLTPLNIGPIAPNDSIIVYFNVTINSGLPAGTTYIATRATIAGTNFSSIVSDDPDTGVPADSTKTPLALSTLPVNFLSFSAQEINGTVDLLWKVTAQVNVNHYEIQRSSDGIHFDNIGQIPALAAGIDLAYIFNDANPPFGFIYYRVRSVDNDLRSKFSSIIKIKLNDGNTKVSVSPNPVRDNMFDLHLSNLLPGEYAAEIYNSTGQLVLKRTIRYNGGVRTELIVLPPKLMPGVYHLHLRNGRSRYMEKLLVQ
ncbi:MAG TPA: T9SS type A sorting domain-containing protein [Chitinophagaceae bacterium]|jgi:hypothetical protein|nr:T9SS type A sorting domain-containing protein [Chitinophagaceae bacterium]